MRRLATWCIASAFLAAAFAPQSAQSRSTPKPNYELAADWTAQKVGRLVFDTTVAPRWLETGDRFWYAYQTREGRKFYLVDPLKKSKAPLFDHAKMAATLTSITREPYDAQHLPFTSVRFVTKDAAFQFDVQVPRDADVLKPKRPTPPSTSNAQQDQDNEPRLNGAAGDNEPRLNGAAGDDIPQRGRGANAGGRGNQPPKNRTLHFEYDMASGNVELLDDDYKGSQRPRWAQVSPDGKTVVFARNHNLFMMDADSFALAQKKADDPQVKEVQLTTDGEEHYDYARSAQQLQQEQEQLQQQQQDEGGQQQIEDQTGGENKNARVPAIQILWSKDSRKIAFVRRDQRKVADLWVIDSLAQPRPKLETYRYAMPGEANVTQYEVATIDIANQKLTRVKADKFKDQTLQIATAPVSPRFQGGRGGGGGQGGGQQNPDAPPPMWLSDSSDQLYLTRQSRDLHKVDVLVAAPDTGDVRVLLEERLNTYIETKPLRLIDGGKNLLFWSERTGWGHYYVYDAMTGALKNALTSGEFVTMNVEAVDDRTRVAFVSAVGREGGEDPYFPHLYR